MQANVSVQESGSSANAGTLSAFSSGFARVLSSPLLVVGMWLLSLGTALFATLPVRAMLRDVLSLRPIADKIARGEYDVGLIEVMSDNPAAMAAASSTLMTAALLYVLLQALVAGGVLSRLSPADAARHVPAGRLLVRSAETAGAMLKLELLFALAVRTPLLLVAAALCGTVLGWQKVGSLAWDTVSARLIPVGLAFVMLWSLASSWLHLARLRRLDDESLSAWRALVNGGKTLSLSPVLSGALLLALLSVGGHGGLLWIGRLVTAKLDAKLLLLVAFLVRQGLSLVRTTLSLWALSTTCSLDAAVSSRTCAR